MTLIRPCCKSDWEQAIALAWKLRDGGITVPWLDCLITVTALRDDLRLYAVDQHFKAIAKCTGLRLYAPGYGGTFTPDP